MKTNFEELLNNTNLTSIKIIKYYEEEIMNELELCNNMYWSHRYLYGSYAEFINEKAEKIEEQNTKVVNLILEFTSLIKYLTAIYYKNAHFSSSIKDKIEELEHEVKYNPTYLHAGTIIEYTCQIIKGFYNDLSRYFKSKSREKERLNALAQEKVDIEEFYITELNRLLDEKETRIYELEDENKRNEQEIDSLINENVCLRRIIEINNDEEEY